VERGVIGKPTGVVRRLIPAPKLIYSFDNAVNPEATSTGDTVDFSAWKIMVLGLSVTAISLIIHNVFSTSALRAAVILVLLLQGVYSD
jgi:hypothetical protein